MDFETWTIVSRHCAPTASTPERQLAALAELWCRRRCGREAGTCTTARSRFEVLFAGARYGYACLFFTSTTVGRRAFGSARRRRCATTTALRCSRRRAVFGSSGRPDQVKGRPDAGGRLVVEGANLCQICTRTPCHAVPASCCPLAAPSKLSERHRRDGLGADLVIATDGGALGTEAEVNPRL